MNIGEQIKQARLAKGISIYRVSKETGITQQNISLIERGHNTTVKTLSRICDAIGCEINIVSK